MELNETGNYIVSDGALDEILSICERIQQSLISEFQSNKGEKELTDFAEKSPEIQDLKKRLEISLRENPIELDELVSVDVTNREWEFEEESWDVVYLSLITSVFSALAVEIDEDAPSMTEEEFVTIDEDETECFRNDEI